MVVDQAEAMFQSIVELQPRSAGGDGGLSIQVCNTRMAASARGARFRPDCARLHMHATSSSAPPLGYLKGPHRASFRVPVGQRWLLFSLLREMELRMDEVACTASAPFCASVPCFTSTQIAELRTLLYASFRVLALSHALAHVRTGRQDRAKLALDDIMDRLPDQFDLNEVCRESEE